MALIAHTGRQAWRLLPLSVVVVACTALLFAAPTPADQGIAVAPDEILPLNRDCTVVLDTREGQTELSGRLLSVNDRWLVLQVEREGTSETGVPSVVNKVPYTSRLFKNVGVGRTSEDCWISRERVVYVRAASSRANAEDLHKLAPEGKDRRQADEVAP